MSMEKNLMGGTGSRLPLARRTLSGVDLNIFLLGWSRQAGAWRSSLRGVYREDTRVFLVPGVRQGKVLKSW